MHYKCYHRSAASLEKSTLPKMKGSISVAVTLGATEKHLVGQPYTVVTLMS